MVVATIGLTDIKVKWWSEELSKNQYDGIIGLSQGAAMAGLLISMVSLIPGTYSVLRGFC